MSFIPARLGFFPHIDPLHLTSLASPKLYAGSAVKTVSPQSLPFMCVPVDDFAVEQCTLQLKDAR